VTTKSPIATALEQMEVERANLAARLAKVDELIASTRDLFHLPNGRPAKVRKNKISEVETKIPHRNGQPASTRKADKVKDAIRAALARGAMSSADIAAKVGLNPPAMLYHLSRMKKSGILVTTGASSSTRYALATASKEAPQR